MEEERHELMDERLYLHRRDEIIALRHVPKTAHRHGWLAILPDLNQCTRFRSFDSAVLDQVGFGSANCNQRITSGE
jgi:hypothetical protein